MLYTDYATCSINCSRNRSRPAASFLGGGRGGREEVGGVGGNNTLPWLVPIEVC